MPSMNCNNNSIPVIISIHILFSLRDFINKKAAMAIDSIKLIYILLSTAYRILKYSSSTRST